jgi:CheY-like chemotaxis protein
MPPDVSNSPLLRLLIVEDNLADALLAVATLERNGRRLSTARVDTKEAFLSELANGPDLILCDYYMPSFSAPEALELLIQQGLDVPFIVLSGSIGEETAVEMIKRGAADYLLKDRIGRLDAAVQRALEQKRLRDETKRAMAHLQQSELRYRCLFDHLMDAAYLCDVATLRIIDTNRQSERLLGLERAEILGSRLGLYFQKSALDGLRGLPEDDVDASVRFEAEMTGGKGGRVQINGTSIIVPPRRLLLVLVRTPGE